MMCMEHRCHASACDRQPHTLGYGSPHSFAPDPLGTACTVPGCWGWVDDPRHVYDVRLAKMPPIILASERVTSRRRYAPRGARHKLRRT